MTKAQLIDYGESRGVEGLSDRMKKAEIIDAMEEGLS